MASDPETAASAADADAVIRCGRNGKASACNTGVEHSRADVVVFTDANCQIQPAEWPSLTIKALNNFDLVSARKGESGGLEQLFWKFEDVLKKSQPSRPTLAVAGEFIATRRTSYIPIPADSILDDFVLAASYVARGLAVGVDKEIHTVEQAAEPNEQWERRVRIAYGLLHDALPLTAMLARYPVGREFLLHKLYRVTVGCAGFWVSLLSIASASPPAAIIALSCAGYSFLAYRGALTSPRWMSPVVAAVGMQFVPPTALGRVMRRHLGGTQTSTALWRKLER